LIVVPADSDAKIPLGYSQRGVTYRLCDHRSGDAIVTGTGKQQRKYEVQGTGGPVELPTPPVLEDVNYKIMAIRQAGNFTKLGERAAWLHTQVTLKEGVDTTLDAHIEAQILDGTLDNPRSSDARLVYHGDAVDVLVDLSQEGVQYELVDHAQPDRVLSTATVIGTGGTIALRSLAMTEDIDLRVRARKAIDEEHAGGVIREALLDLILPLRVRASLEPQVVITGGEVLAYGGNSKLEVRDRQASATYRVWIRDAFDEVYVYDPNPAVPVVEVAVPAASEGEEARTVRLARSEYKRWWYSPARFAAITAGTVSGTSVGFTLGPFSHDQEVIVQALKTHQYGPLDRPSVGARDTAVELRQARAVLVGPEPKPSLRVRVREGIDQPATVELLAGEPGVHYSLVKTGGKATVAQTAYVHQRDDADSRFNKGVGQLRVEGDLVVVRDGAEVPSDRSREAPSNARLELSGVVDGTRWKLVARQTMNDLEVELQGRANTGTAPQASLESPTVAAGSSAKVTVAASDAAMRYLLEDGAGKVLASAVGTGAELILDSGALEAGTRLW
ncbi:MAG: hypothetical protein KC431_29505, partial [Myxococcales bacterium]|nr:hypothetical protein [Myxococcales bacterium]